MLFLIFTTALAAEGLSDTKGMNVLSNFILGNCVRNIAECLGSYPSSIRDKKDVSFLFDHLINI